MADARQIAEVHELDIKAARQNIRAACERTSAEWIPSNAITEALLREFFAHAARTTSEQHLIKNLENLVVALKQKQESGPLQ